MKALHVIAFILVIVGGLNWLLVAFGWNLVHAIFGFSMAVENAIYVLVGLSAIYLAATHSKDCKTCKAGNSMPSAM